MIRFIFFKNRSFTIIIFWKVKCLTDCKGRVNIDWRDFGFSSNGVSIRWDLVWCKGSCQRRQWHPLQYSCLENPMDRGAWWAAVHGVAKSRTRLSDFTFIFTFMHWRRKWQPTPVFLPGESQGRGSLVGCRLWGHTESDTTEVT